MSQRSTYLQLFLSHRSALIDYAAPIVGCRSRAEDVVQEAYIRFSARGEEGCTGERIANPVGYLYRIVRNLAVDWARRFSTEAPLPDPEQLNRIPAAIPTAEDTVFYRGKLRVLAEALAELPERTQIAFAMHRLEGRPLQEVAHRLGVSVVRAHQMVKEAVLHGAKRLDRADD